MDLSLYAGLAGLAVVLVEQVLKLKIVPLSIANKYPVPVLLVLSVLASVVIVWQDKVSQPVNALGWVALVATVAVVAAVVYNQIFSRWTELREMEGSSNG